MMTTFLFVKVKMEVVLIKSNKMLEYASLYYMDVKIYGS